MTDQATERVDGETAAVGRARRARQQLVFVLLAGVVGAALVLVAAGRGWAHVVIDQPAPLSAGRRTLSGSQLAPALDGLGLAGLAGLAGILATRGAGRIVVGFLLVVLGAAAAATSAVGARPAHVRSVAAGIASLNGTHAPIHLVTTGWWVVAAVGGVLLLATGLATVLRGRRWPGMSSRYDAPGPSGSRDGTSAEELWDSLDAGTDPTVGEDVR